MRARRPVRGVWCTRAARVEDYASGIVKCSESVIKDEIRVTMRILYANCEYYLSYEHSSPVGWTRKLDFYIMDIRVGWKEFIFSKHSLLFLLVYKRIN